MMINTRTAGNGLPSQEHATLIGEGIAIVVRQVILLWPKSRPDVAQEVQKHLEGQLGLAETTWTVSVLMANHEKRTLRSWSACRKVFGREDRC